MNKRLGEVEHTEAEARQIYHDIGLCYGCGKRLGRCTCGDNAEWKQAGIVDRCVCFEFAGDNDQCPVHKSLEGYTSAEKTSLEKDYSHGKHYKD